jgi:hypothetical protein
MKHNITRITIFFLFLIILSACQTNTTTNKSDTSSTQNNEEAYPVNQLNTISSDQSDISSGYPIPEEHAVILSKTWVLSTRVENGISQEPIEKTLILYEDGRYEIITADNTSTGIWTTRTTSSGTELFLDIGTANASMYEIQIMNPDSLLILFHQDGIEIEEQYLPQD